MNDFYWNRNGSYFAGTIVGCDFECFLIVIYFLPLSKHLMYPGGDILNISMHLDT